MSNIFSILGDNINKIHYGQVDKFRNYLNKISNNLFNNFYYFDNKLLIKQIQFLENYFKITINVDNEDYETIYKSSNSYLKTLNLRLVFDEDYNEFKYEVIKSKRKFHINYYSNKHDKIIMRYLSKSKKDKALVYYLETDEYERVIYNELFENKNENRENSEEDIKKLKKEFKNSFITTFKSIYSIFFRTNEEIKPLDLLLKFVNSMNEIKYYDLMNFDKFQHFILFNVYSTTNKYNIDSKVKNITINEYPFIKNVNAQLTKYYKTSKKLYQYDMANAYPFILKNYNKELNDILYIPINEGVIREKNYKYLNDDIKNHKLYAYSIYSNIKIIKDGKNKLQKFIKINPSGFYTMLDLYDAYDAGCSFEKLDETKQIMFISWNKDKDCVASYEVFGKYITDMFALKRKYPSNKLIKSFLSRIHGVFIQNNIFKQYTDENTYKIELDEEDKNKWLSIDDGVNKELFTGSKRVFSFLNKEHPFRSQYARFAPFLYSYQRHYMLKQIKKYNLEDNICAVKTDAFVLNCKVDEWEQNDINNKTIGEFYKEDIDKEQFDKILKSRMK